MNEAMHPKISGSVPVKQGIVDCDIHPRPKNNAAVARFLPRKWKDYHDEVGGYGSSVFATAHSHPRSAPVGCRRDAWGADGTLPGSDLDMLRAQLLDPMGTEYGILIPLNFSGSSQRNQELGVAMSRAQNDWQIAEWLEREPRLRGSIQITQDDPTEAVAEIERCAKDKRFVQIQMHPRSTEPLGRKRYWPIYEAAAGLGLPIMAHVGGASGHASHAGGWASTYFEEHNGLTLVGPSMLTSLVLEGVPERWPSLKFVLVEMSFTWVPTTAARLDRLFQRYAPETPHLTRLPSEYVRNNFMFTTQPMDAPEQPERLREVMDAVGWDNLMFSSDYPHWDQDDPTHAFPFAMSKDQKGRLLAGNAKRLYGLN